MCNNVNDSHAASQWRHRCYRQMPVATPCLVGGGAKESSDVFSQSGAQAEAGARAACTKTHPCALAAQQPATSSLSNKLNSLTRTCVKGALVTLLSECTHVSDVKASDHQQGHARLSCTGWELRPNNTPSQHTTTALALPCRYAFTADAHAGTPPVHGQHPAPAPSDRNNTSLSEASSDIDAAFRCSGQPLYVLQCEHIGADNGLPAHALCWGKRAAPRPPARNDAIPKQAAASPPSWQAQAGSLAESLGSNRNSCLRTDTC